jgi:hypothetical protein
MSTKTRHLLGSPSRSRFISLRSSKTRSRFARTLHGERSCSITGLTSSPNKAARPAADSQGLCTVKPFLCLKLDTGSILPHRSHFISPRSSSKTRSRFARTLLGERRLMSRNSLFQGRRQFPPDALPLLLCRAARNLAQALCRD